jgi:hypothetical protein
MLRYYKSTAKTPGTQRKYIFDADRKERKERPGSQPAISPNRMK